MIRTHCGEKLQDRSDWPTYFSRRCVKCGRIFIQRKRRPDNKKKGVTMDNRTAVLVELGKLIKEIEAAKSRLRLEYDAWHADYALRGKIAGYTKRQTEAKLGKLRGEIFGIESALSVLYKYIAPADEAPEDDDPIELGNLGMNKNWPTK